MEGTLLALSQSADFGLVVGVADHAGDVPSAGEEERSQMEGDFAVATEEKDVHFCLYGFYLFNYRHGRSMFTE